MFILVLKKTLPSETVVHKTKLPFKEYNEALPDNFDLSKIRLNNPKTRSDKNKNLMVEYDKIIKQYINDSIVEPIRSAKTYDFESEKLALLRMLNKHFHKLKSKKTIEIFYDLLDLTMFYLTNHPMFYYVFQELFSVKIVAHSY